MVNMQMYPPLTEQEYAETFQTLNDTCTEAEEIPLLAKPVVEMFEGKTIKMLSIGAGTAWIETALLKLGLKLSFYCAVEPTSLHVKELKKTVQSWGSDIQYEIMPIGFTTDFTTDHRFDLIMMSHSLYCIREWKQILAHVTKFLAPAGKFILFHQGMDEHPYEVFVKHAQVQPEPVQDHTLTIKHIAQEFKDKNIKHKITKSNSKIEMNKFVEGHEDGNATHVVSFLLQTLYVNLRPELKKIIKDQVISNCKKEEDGLFWFYHPCAMFLIEN